MFKFFLYEINKFRRFLFTFLKEENINIILTANTVLKDYQCGNRFIVTYLFDTADS